MLADEAEDMSRHMRKLDCQHRHKKKTNDTVLLLKDE